MISYEQLLSITLATGTQYYYNANSSDPVNYDVTEESVRIYGSREVIHVEHIGDKTYYGLSL